MRYFPVAITLAFLFRVQAVLVWDFLVATNGKMVIRSSFVGGLRRWETESND